MKINKVNKNIIHVNESELKYWAIENTYLDYSNIDHLKIQNKEPWFTLHVDYEENQIDNTIDIELFTNTYTLNAYKYMVKIEIHGTYDVSSITYGSMGNNNRLQKINENFENGIFYVSFELIDNNRLGLFGKNVNIANLIFMKINNAQTFNIFNISKCNITYNEKFKFENAHIESVYTVTEQNYTYDLYSCGYNRFGLLGVGNVNYRNNEIVANVYKIQEDISYFVNAEESVLSIKNGMVYGCGKLTNKRIGFNEDNYDTTTVQPGSTTHKCLTTMTKSTNETFFIEQNIIEIYTSKYRTFFKLDDGRIYTTGLNSTWGSGVLLTGDTQPIHDDMPILIDKNELDRISNVRKIVSADYHAIVLTYDGEIYACGNNIFARLAIFEYIRSNENYAHDNKTKLTKCSFQTNEVIIDVGVNVTQSIFLTAEGNVYACGNNENGQLGVGHSNQITTGHVSNNYPIVKCLVQNVKQISVGVDHTLFLTNDNRVYGCGKNEFGQLSIQLTRTDNIISTPAEIMIPETVIQIQAAQQCSLFLSDTGNVYGCGINDYNQLGTNEYRQCYTNIVQSNIHNVCKIFAKGKNTFFIKAKQDTENIEYHNAIFGNVSVTEHFNHTEYVYHKTVDIWPSDGIILQSESNIYYNKDSIFDVNLYTVIAKNNNTPKTRLGRIIYDDTSNITVNGTVDTTTIGTYQLEYIYNYLDIQKNIFSNVYVDEYIVTENYIKQNDKIYMNENDSLITYLRAYSNISYENNDIIDDIELNIQQEIGDEYNVHMIYKSSETIHDSRRFYLHQLSQNEEKYFSNIENAIWYTNPTYIDKKLPWKNVHIKSDIIDSNLEVELFTSTQNLRYNEHDSLELFEISGNFDSNYVSVSNISINNNYNSELSYDLNSFYIKGYNCVDENIKKSNYIHICKIKFEVDESNLGYIGFHINQATLLDSFDIKMNHDQYIYHNEMLTWNEHNQFFYGLNDEDIVYVTEMPPGLKVTNFDDYFEHSIYVYDIRQRQDNFNSHSYSISKNLNISTVYNESNVTYAFEYQGQNYNLIRNIVTNRLEYPIQIRDLGYSVNKYGEMSYEPTWFNTWKNGYGVYIKEYHSSIIQNILNRNKVRLYIHFKDQPARESILTNTDLDAYYIQTKQYWKEILLPIRNYAIEINGERIPFANMDIDVEFYGISLTNTILYDIQDGVSRVSGMNYSELLHVNTEPNDLYPNIDDKIMNKYHYDYTCLNNTFNEYNGVEFVDNPSYQDYANIYYDYSVIVDVNDIDSLNIVDDDVIRDWYSSDHASGQNYGWGYVRYANTRYPFGKSIENEKRIELHEMHHMLYMSPDYYFRDHYTYDEYGPMVNSIMGHSSKLCPIDSHMARYFVDNYGTNTKTHPVTGESMKIRDILKEFELNMIVSVNDSDNTLEMKNVYTFNGSETVLITDTLPIYILVQPNDQFQIDSNFKQIKFNRPQIELDSSLQEKRNLIRINYETYAVQIRVDGSYWYNIYTTESDVSFDISKLPASYIS